MIKLGVIGGARVVATAAQAVTFLLVARALGPADFGAFAAVFGGLTALGILADGGATTAVGRHHQSPEILVPVLRAGRLLSIATMSVSVPVLGLAVHLSRSPVVTACLLLCLWVPLERQAEVAGAVLLARGRAGVVGAGYLTRRVGSALAVLVAPPSHVVVAFAATMVLGAGVSLVVLRRHMAETVGGRGPAPALLEHRSVWALLRPYWIVVGGNALRQLDVVVLGVVGGATAAGVFAPASRLVPPLLLVPGTYTQLLLARLAASREPLPAAPVVGVAVVSMLTFGPLALLADVWVPLLLGEAYAASVDVVRVVVGGLALAALSSVFAAALHATDRAARVAVAVWAGAVTMIGLVAVLGTVHGALGAAWAVATGYFVQCALMAGFHRFGPIPTPQPVIRRRANT